MLKNKKAILFDLDGTLMDSMWLWESIDIEYLGRYGLSLPENLQRAIDGMSFTETACYFKERFQIPDSIEQIKDDWNQMAFDKYANEVPLKAGALNFLQFLKENGLKMAIASSNSRELIHACLEHNNVAQYFDEIIISCDVPKGKPAPDVYLRAAKLLKEKPEDCLVFEDIIQGVEAGKNAGMEVCAIYDRRSDFQKAQIRNKADYYIVDFNQIMNHTFEVLK